jgi:hypothetical protein
VNLDRKFQKIHQENYLLKRVTVPVLAAPYITDRMAEVCESHGWSWLDLAGNCRISIPDVLHLERRGNAPVHQPDEPTVNLSTPETARILRALLNTDTLGVHWTQRTLKKATFPQVSIGLVNKVVNFLKAESHLESSSAKGGFRLKDPEALLLRWREVYRPPVCRRVECFTLLKGRNLADTLSQIEEAYQGKLAYASFSAGAFWAPHVRQPQTWLYVAEKICQPFMLATESRPVNTGANLMVWVTNEDGVFDGLEASLNNIRQTPYTNPVQTYLDLWNSGGRGQEAADELLQQVIRPDWKLRGVLS